MQGGAGTSLDLGYGRLWGVKTLPGGCEETGCCSAPVPTAQMVGAGCWQAGGAPQALGVGLQRWGVHRGSGTVSGHARWAQLGHLKASAQGLGVGARSGAQRQCRVPEHGCAAGAGGSLRRDLTLLPPSPGG